MYTSRTSFVLCYVTVPLDVEVWAFIIHFHVEFIDRTFSLQFWPYMIHFSCGFCQEESLHQQHLDKRKVDDHEHKIVSFWSHILSENTEWWHFVIFLQKDDKDMIPIEVNQIRSVKVSRGARNIPKAFEIFTGDQSLILKPKDGKNAEEWVQCLSIVVAHSHSREIPAKSNSLPARGASLRTAVWSKVKDLMGHVPRREHILLSHCAGRPVLQHNCKLSVTHLHIVCTSTGTFFFVTNWERWEICTKFWLGNLR